MVSAETVVSGPVLLLPSAMAIVEQGPSHVIVAPRQTREDRGDPIPDVLIGTMPFVHLNPEGLPSLAELWIPPPPPFRDEDVRMMWNEIDEAACPLPHSVLAQGGLGPGRIAERREIGLTADFVALAYRRARALLARWPPQEAYELIWRNIELRGGREDFQATERRMPALAALKTKDGRPLPQKTARRRGIEDPWTSWLLYDAALAVVKEAGALGDRVIEDLPWRKVTAAFRAVAGRARPDRSSSDSPVSTWPIAARLCYEGFLAALSVVRSTKTGAATAPLSYLWRLFEAWVAVSSYRTLVDRFGPSIEAPEAASGCEWRARWQLNGSSLSFLAQARIDGTGVPAAPPAARIRSISSDLIPDVLLIVEPSEGDVRIGVIDAKQRLVHTGMGPRDVAEAASKYVWGIRRQDEIRALPVVSALVVSSMPAGNMYSKESRIRAQQALPSNSSGLASSVQELAMELLEPPG